MIIIFEFVILAVMMAALCIVVSLLAWGVRELWRLR